MADEHTLTVSQGSSSDSAPVTVGAAPGGSASAPATTKTGSGGVGSFGTSSFGS
ncbi:hypothetical protein ACIRRA_04655 [Nocardia sp. NPDC101769]|uniref:hypothetical protein n=1 Tax=Nocardia sp. NPDC101769 TaxID=3364333 RepID=UPI00381AFE27